MNLFLKSFAAAALLAGGLFASAASAAEILLQSVFTDGFVRAERGVLVADGNERNALRLDVIRLDRNRVALRTSDGSYVRAGVGRDAQLAAGSPRIGGWETFELNERGGRVSLRSVQNGRYVETDRRGLLSATADRPSELTTFRVAEAGRPGGPRPPHDGNRPPRFEWTGNWPMLRVAGPDGRLLAPPRGSRVQFSIGRDMRVGASVGCNRIASQLRVEGRDRAEFTQAISTRMFCQGSVGRYEQALLEALREVRRYEYREGQVAFLDRRGRTVLQIGR